MKIVPFYKAIFPNMLIISCLVIGAVTSHVYANNDRGTSNNRSTSNNSNINKSSSTNNNQNTNNDRSTNSNNMNNRNLNNDSNNNEMSPRPDTEDIGITGSDADITSQTHKLLTSDNDLKNSNINVTTRDGVVTLEGRVSDSKAKSLAEKRAKSIHGVDKVNNNLKISD